MPSAPDLAELTGWVQRLAPEFGQPAFVPHVTIQGDLETPLDTLQSQTAALAASCPVLHWQVNAVQSTDHFFRCLYLRFDETPAFRALQAGALAISGTVLGMSPYPHLSLAYGQMQTGQQPLLTAVEEKFITRRLTFDRISICRSSKDIPIPEWTCLQDFPLKPIS
jgi:2'-5' RNA ligase